MPKGLSTKERTNDVEIVLDGRTLSTVSLDGTINKRTCPKCNSKTGQRCIYVWNESEQIIHLCDCGQLFYSNRAGDIVSLGFFLMPKRKR